MPKTLIVNNTPYAYPTSGDEPGWGGDATGWASGVTDVLNDLLGPDDILQTAFNITNNVSVAEDITGLAFNAASVRAADIDYSVFRVSGDSPDGQSETGKLRLLYDNAVGWSIGSGGIIGNSGVSFSILPSGQLQYTSTELTGGSYVGTMKFRAKALQQ